jgi:hypothetical protein
MRLRLVMGGCRRGVFGPQRSPLHAERSEDAVRILLRQRCIEAVVVELVAAHRGGEREQSVAGELVGVGVAELSHLVDGCGAQRRGRQEERRHGIGEPARRGDRCGIRSLHRAPKEERNPHRGERDSGQDQGDGIRLADVADDLVRIEEVVDGDEIEPGGEFEPERRLRNHAEQEHEQGQREPAEAQAAMDAGCPPTAGQQRFVEQHGCQEHGEGGKVEPEPLRKHRGPQGRRHGGCPGPRRKPDACQRAGGERDPRVEKRNAGSKARVETPIDHCFGRVHGRCAGARAIVVPGEPAAPVL